MIPMCVHIYLLYVCIIDACSEHTMYTYIYNPTQQNSSINKYRKSSRSQLRAYTCTPYKCEMKKEIYQKHDINGLHKRDKKPCRVIDINIYTELPREQRKQNNTAFVSVSRYIIRLLGDLAMRGFWLK